MSQIRLRRFKPKTLAQERREVIQRNANARERQRQNDLFKSPYLLQQRNRPL